MSIHIAIKQKEHSKQIEDLLAQMNSLQKEVDTLKSRIAAMESRPRPGRPPKDNDGRTTT